MRQIVVAPGRLVIGGSATLADTAAAAATAFPELEVAISRMCSQQVRNLATLAGSIANASPIADSVPLLMVAGAVLHLNGPQGERCVPIRDFYVGYKRTLLMRGEWIDQSRLRPTVTCCSTRKRPAKAREPTSRLSTLPSR